MGVPVEYIVLFWAYSRAIQEGTRQVHSTKGKKKKKRERKRKEEEKKLSLSLTLTPPPRGERENSANCFHPARHQDRSVLTSFGPFERTTSIDQPATLLSLLPARIVTLPHPFPLSHSGGYNISSSCFVSLSHPPPPPIKEKRGVTLSPLFLPEITVFLGPHHQSSPIIHRGITSGICHHDPAAITIFCCFVFLLPSSSSIVFHLLFEYLETIPF